MKEEGRINEGVGGRFVAVFVNGSSRGVVGGLCWAIVVESTRGGAGGVPLDTARSALVSNLFVGEAPGRWLGGLVCAGEPWPRNSRALS